MSQQDRSSLFQNSQTNKHTAYLQRYICSSVSSNLDHSGFGDLHRHLHPAAQGTPAFVQLHLFVFTQDLLQVHRIMFVRQLGTEEGCTTLVSSFHSSCAILRLEVAALVAVPEPAPRWLPSSDTASDAAVEHQLWAGAMSRVSPAGTGLLSSCRL